MIYNREETYEMTKTRKQGCRDYDCGIGSQNQASNPIDVVLFAADLLSEYIDPNKSEVCG